MAATYAVCGAHPNLREFYNGLVRDFAPGAVSPIEDGSAAQDRMPTHGEAAVLSAIRFANREYRVGGGQYLQDSADLLRCAEAAWIHARDGWWTTPGGDAALERAVRTGRASER